MRTRQKGYKDYNFTEGEARQLLAWCRSADFPHRKSLLESCRKANPGIENDLFYSIVRNVSFERMPPQYCAKVDFYAYRRLALSIFRDALKKRRLYPFT